MKWTLWEHLQWHNSSVMRKDFYRGAPIQTWRIGGLTNRLLFGKFAIYRVSLYQSIPVHSWTWFRATIRQHSFNFVGWRHWQSISDCVLIEPRYRIVLLKYFIFLSCMEEYMGCKYPEITWHLIWLETRSVQSTVPQLCTYTRSCSTCDSIVHVITPWTNALTQRRNSNFPVLYFCTTELL